MEEVKKKRGGQPGNKGGGRKTLPKEIIDKVQEKTYRETLKELMPDILLAQKHLELLTVPKKVRKFIKGEMVDEYEELDSQAVSKGLDMAYKLKGEYAPEKRELSVDKGLEEVLKKFK
jgi:hypothetical protein